MLGEFRAFLLKTNALALAIGVIIGGALGTVVNSLVNDIIMPPLGWAMGGIDFSDFYVVLKGAAYPTLDAAKAAGAETKTSAPFARVGQVSDLGSDQAEAIEEFRAYLQEHDET